MSRTDIAVRRPMLEDVFLKLTGRACATKRNERSLCAARSMTIFIRFTATARRFWTPVSHHFIILFGAIFGR
jgi:hypothetical protein